MLEHEPTCVPAYLACGVNVRAGRICAKLKQRRAWIASASLGWPGNGVKMGSRIFHNKVRMRRTRRMDSRPHQKQQFSTDVAKIGNGGSCAAP